MHRVSGQFPNGERWIAETTDGVDQPEPVHKAPVSLWRTNRQRLVAAMREAGHTEGYIYHCGAKAETLHGTDCHKSPFRNESFFLWLFGVGEPDCAGAISLADGTARIFVPRLPPEYSVWVGRIEPPSVYAERYGVDAADYTDAAATFLASAPAVFVLDGASTDSSLPVPVPDCAGIPNVRRGVAHPIAAALRAIKTPAEMDVLRYAARVSSRAHVRVMASTRPGTGDHQAEADFRHGVAHAGGMRHCAYECIVAVGDEAAVLHKVHVGRAIKETDLCLFDMGGEAMGYSADITVTFPASGRFSAEQAVVYDAVLAATKAVEAAAKPGVPWPAMHVLAQRVILAHLAAADYVRPAGAADAAREAGVFGAGASALCEGYGGPESEDIKALCDLGVASLFMPHGLGHLLGLDVHDVGGYLSTHPPRGTQPPGVGRLRTARVLEEGMYLTVEPGCYFNAATLHAAAADPAKARWLNVDKVLAAIDAVGGVRLEDDCLITATHCEVVSCVPRERADVEAVCAGGPWTVR